MKKLLLTEPSDIKLQRRQGSSFLALVRHIQLIGGFLGMFRFMLGAEIAEAIRTVLFRIMPRWQDDSEDDSLASSGSRDMSEKGLQDSRLHKAQDSSLHKAQDSSLQDV